MRPRSALGLLIVAVALAACGTTASPAPTAGAPAGGYPGWPIGPDPNASMVPLIVSSELVPGPNRFLFALTDTANAPIAAPDLATTVRFYDLEADPATPAVETSGSFVWTVPDKIGLYHATVDFGRAGPWGVEILAVKAGQPERTVRARFDVRDTGTTPALGSRVPASDTLTAGTPDEIAAISTDAHPDPDFYRTSVADALAAGRPFVLVFATPLFCSSQTCGPTLENVKGIAAPYKDRVAFIHVEPYKLKQADDALQPDLDASGGFQIVPAVAEWGLPTEPWIFVVAADGTLAAKFEGAVGPDELRAALDALVGGLGG